MKNLKSEDGVVGRGVDGDGEVLVPNRPSRSTVVGFGGESAIRVNPEDGVGFEVSIAPVHILEMLCGDDGHIEVQKLRRRGLWLNP